MFLVKIASKGTTLSYGRELLGKISIKWDLIFFIKVEVVCLIIHANCTPLLTGTQEKKFQDVFLVKIASKGTTLSYGRELLGKISIKWDLIFFIKVEVVCLIIHGAELIEYSGNNHCYLGQILVLYPQL